MASFAREAIRGKNRAVSGIAALAALAGLLFGFDTGVISGAQLYISKDLHASTTTQSWYVGALLLGACAGAAAGGYLADRISRKSTIIASGIIYVGAALWSGVSNTSGSLIAARAVLGLAVGAASFVGPLYISEHVPPRLRGGTVSFNQLMITSGIMLAYIVDYLFKGVANNWRWMLALGALPGIALTLGMLLVPHTPRWLLEAGREEEARDVLARTRESEDDVDDEVREVEKVLESEREGGFTGLFSAEIRPMMVVGLGLAFFQQAVGVNTVVYYAPTILKYTGLTANQSVTEALSVGITNVVFTVIAILLMDRVGRRKLLLVGTAGLTVALGALGAFFASATLRSDASWLAVVALVVFIAAFAIGLGPVFWLMISEIFPLRMRSRAMAVCTLVNWGANFIVSYFFLQLVAAVGRPSTFWIYTGFGVLAVLFFSLRVPETAGRSLEEIEHELGAHGAGEAQGDGANQEPDSAERSKSASKSATLG
jgi:sugar porter (SP) family MFS transporter